MNVKKSVLLLAVGSGLALGTAQSADAAIVVDSTFAGTGHLGFGSRTYTLASAFDASASDKLVVAVATEHNFGGTSAPGVPIITYNGVALTQAADSLRAPTRTSIYYLDNPGAAGDLLYNSNGGSNGAGWAVYLLSGTEDGVGNTSASNGMSTNVVTTANDSIVIGSVLTNGVNNGNNPPLPTADAPQTQTASVAWPLGPYGAIGGGYQIVAGSGTNALVSFTAANDGNNSHIAAAEFTAVPEPGSLALLGLGGLLIARRRRA